ncbi:MAG: hypothetical protein H0W06_08175 [Chloroflexia bacterium]|nr:hypothetical protein [Chloroflexia bacterium]
MCRERDGLTPEEVFYDAAARFLDVQIRTNHELDNKTANAFSVGSTVLPLTFGLLNLSARTVPITTIIALVLALVAYLALVSLALRASRIRALEYRPDLPTLERHSETYPGDSLRRWVATEYLASIEMNQANLERKAYWVGAVTTALYAEGLLLSLAALFTLL